MRGSLPPPVDRTHGLQRVRPARKDAGTAPGINIAPGSDDDGWVVPPPVKLSDGSEIQLYKDGEAWHANFEAISAARSRVCVELYIFASDETGRAVAELLCQKARAGVAVYVLYDSFGSLYSDRSMFESIRRAGGHVLEFHPMRPWECRFTYRPINRDHRKLICVDDDFAGLGGMNLAKEYAGSWIVKSRLTGADLGQSELWRDNGIAVRGPAGNLLRDSFAKTWDYALHGGPVGKTQLIHPYGTGDSGILASAPSTDSPVQASVCEQVRSAKTSIDLTVAYFAPGDSLVDELCAAARRGVRVRLMLPGRGDVKLLVIAARSFYAKMMACGIEIYERQNVVLHAKTAVFDAQTVVIGSTNLDYRSIEYNLELSAVVRSPELGRQVQMLFENDLLYSNQIDPAVWKQRPTYDRIVQWAVSRARYLL